MTEVAGFDTKIEIQFQPNVWEQILGPQEYDIEMHLYPDYWFAPYYIIKRATLESGGWSEDEEGCVEWKSNWNAKDGERVTPDGWLWRPVFWMYRMWLKIKSWIGR